MRKIWDKGPLAQWQASLSEQRKRADEKTLTQIFQQAARVPELKDALEWAKTHDIDFIIDRTTSVQGYYTSDTGVVAIKKQGWIWRTLFNEIATGEDINVMVHEIRHAWQDYNLMIPASKTNSFADFFIRTALIEADAYAHGELAEYQYSLALRMDHARDGLIREKYERKLEQSRYSADRIWRYFQDWYQASSKWYGSNILKYFGEALKINHIKIKNKKFEFDVDSVVSQQQSNTEMDISLWDMTRRLGKRFGGGNYLDVADRDFFYKDALSPSRASEIFSKASKKEIKLAAKIRTQLLKNKTFIDLDH